MKTRSALIIGVIVLSAQMLSPSPAAGDRPDHAVRLGLGDPACTLPDLVQPEGKTRWDLTGLETEPGGTRSLFISNGSVTVRHRTGPDSESRTVWSDQAGSDAAVRFLFPHRFGEQLRPGHVAALELERSRDGLVDRLRVVVETRGIGWIELPSGPREASLQRVLVISASGSMETLGHRWVDPRGGVVASVSGTAAPDGRSRLDVRRVELAEEVLLGASDLILHVDEVFHPAYSRLLYSWDKGPNAPVSSLTPESYPAIGDLIAADTWDFSGNTTGKEVASTVADVNSDETCNMNPDSTGSCGYPGPGKTMEREDIDFGTPDLVKNNQVMEREDRAGDVTIWLRAGALKEGKSGLFGNGESRMCYVTDGGVTRTEVPLWRFANQDADGWYLQAGDNWEAGPFECEQNLFNQVCGEPGIFWDELYTKACDGSDGIPHLGKQSGEVIKGGVVTLPSGHTLNALVVRTLADFCIYTGSDCRDGLFGNKVDEARTVVYLWQVPVLGTVVLLQSEQEVPDTTSFTELETTHIAFGLFPPLSITVTGTADHSIDLSWDPGDDIHRIDSYKIYWDTDSGSTSGYAFDSDTHSGQVTFAGATATVSGLSADTTYYLTVTSRSEYTNPSTGTPVLYESIIYPTQVSGDPDKVYPVEAVADTTGGCVPTGTVPELSVDKHVEGIEICWTRITTDPCVTGYRVLGADSPEAAGNFTPVADVGDVECWQGDPAESYFLVVGTGGGGEGPTGHHP